MDIPFNLHGNAIGAHAILPYPLDRFSRYEYML
jgi:hypothetical protein